MDIFRSMKISSSALTAERLRMDVIAENVANINTTRTADGTPYQRRYTVFQQREAQPFSQYLNDSMSMSYGNGVRVTEIGTDESPGRMKYDPTHPDADESGYVTMPNVDLAFEMVDMMAATRSYEANITALNSFKSIANKALEIGK